FSMLDVLEAGGEELQTEEDQYEVLTEPDRFEEVKTALKSKYPISSAEVTMLPKTYADADDQAVEKLEKLISILEDDDDVQEVYTNYRS
ncbi:YebC/PmpR family DNA-binding transcriptional regulator, partial [Bacillus spizizenii]|nr:YebC/PmpR family DNA-binding transcriptional regulator [Bacillus spizizenii]